MWTIKAYYSFLHRSFLGAWEREIRRQPASPIAVEKMAVEAVCIRQ